MSQNLRLVLSPLINAVSAAFPQQSGAMSYQVLDELIVLQGH